MFLFICVIYCLFSAATGVPQRHLLSSMRHPKNFKEMIASVLSQIGIIYSVQILLTQLGILHHVKKTCTDGHYHCIRVTHCWHNIFDLSLQLNYTLLTLYFWFTYILHWTMSRIRMIFYCFYANCRCSPATNTTATVSSDSVANELYLDTTASESESSIKVSLFY